MVEVLVMTVVVALFAVVCFWFNRRSKLYGKLLIEEKVKNVQLTMENEYYQEKLSQPDYQNHHNNCISIKKLEEVDLLPYWKDDYETVDFRPWKDEYEVKFPDNPFEEFKQTLNDDPLEDFKRINGFYPWEHSNEHHDCSSEYETSGFPLYDDPIKEYKAARGFLPWEWEEIIKYKENIQES